MALIALRIMTSCCESDGCHLREQIYQYCRTTGANAHLNGSYTRTSIDAFITQKQIVILYFLFGLNTNAIDYIFNRLY